MSDSDINVKAVVVKYLDVDKEYFMIRDNKGNIFGQPSRRGALLFTLVQAEKFITHLKKTGFEYKLQIEVVR